MNKQNIKNAFFLVCVVVGTLGAMNPKRDDLLKEISVVMVEMEEKLKKEGYRTIADFESDLKIKNFKLKRTFEKSMKKILQEVNKNNDEQEA